MEHAEGVADVTTAWAAVCLRNEQAVVHVLLHAWCRLVLLCPATSSLVKDLFLAAAYALGS